MIITRTPLRISFFGGGTDYPAYYLKHGGATLASAINKYVYVALHHLTEYSELAFKVHYSQLEAVDELEDLQIPIVREALRLMGISKGLEIYLISELPARTGLGTSSASTVGLLNALHGHLGNEITAERLAMDAIHIEQKMLHEKVGSQDQYICSHGGFAHLSFKTDSEISIKPVDVTPGRLEELEEHLLLFYAGERQQAKEVLTEQIDRTESGELDNRLQAIKDHVEKAIALLKGSGPISQFGELLHETWEQKQTLSSKMTNTHLDQLYQRAQSAGAIGGKLLGAGSGGFMLLFAEPSFHDSVRRAVGALKGVKEVLFGFESSGTTTVYSSP